MGIIALKTEEIPSTGRLPDVMRGGNGRTLDKKSPLPVKNPPERKAKKTLLKSASGPTNISVGAEIGHDFLRLVKAVKSDNTWRVIGHKYISLPPATQNSSSEFHNVVKSEITSFCGGDAKTSIWTVMSSPRVEVRHFRIPKVPNEQIEQVVYWTLKKEAPFDDKKSIFDYEILGEAEEQGVRKLSIMCYAAPIEEVERLKRLFSGTGLALTGISVAPFIVQNIFKTQWMPCGKSTACLFIGDEYSRIDVYADGRLALTRDIKTGVNSMVEMMAEALHGRLGQGGRTAQEKAREILFALGRDENGPIVLDDGYSIVREEAEEAIAPVLERFVRQMERTFDHYTTQLGHEKIGNIYLSSMMPVCRSMVGYFGEHLGIESIVFNPLGSVMAEEDLSKQLAFIPAFGLALSDNAYTPNVLFTYKDKKQKRSEKRLNRIVLAAALAIVFALSGVFIHERVDIARKKTELAQLERQLPQDAGVISRDAILSMVSLKQAEQQKLKDLGKRYAGMAVVSELASLTPETIRLTSVQYAYGEKALKSLGTQVKAKGVVEGALVIDGVITGERVALDTDLASYIVKLNASPMFHNVTLAKSGSSAPDRGNALAFTLNATTGPGK
jgi:Tfp pilus assembly PilM family ATPase/Tfp pilus assembly protein PilN